VQASPHKIAGIGRLVPQFPEGAMKTTRLAAIVLASSCLSPVASAAAPCGAAAGAYEQPTLDDCYAARDALFERFASLSNGIGVSLSPTGRACATTVSFETEALLHRYVLARRALGECADLVILGDVAVEVIGDVAGRIIPFPSVTVGN
jgi:hypothetical protein